MDNKCLSIKSSDLRSLFEKYESITPEGGESPAILPYTDTRIISLLADIRAKFQTLKKIPKITIDYSHGAASHFEQEFLREVL